MFRCLATSSSHAAARRGLSSGCDRTIRSSSRSSRLSRSARVRPTDAGSVAASRSWDTFFIESVSMRKDSHAERVLATPKSQDGKAAGPRPSQRHVWHRVLRAGSLAGRVRNLRRRPAPPARAPAPPAHPASSPPAPHPAPPAGAPAPTPPAAAPTPSEQAQSPAGSPPPGPASATPPPASGHTTCSPPTPTPPAPPPADSNSGPPTPR
jgi:hypothetical protein